MTCSKVCSHLSGYMDGALAGKARERVRQHLEICAECRTQLERHHRLAKLLSRVTPSVPPPDLAVRIRVAVAQAREQEGLAGLLAVYKRRAELLLENVLKPLALPATGGFVTAMLVCVVVLQLIVPGISLEAVPNDVPISLLRPAALVSLSDFRDGSSGALPEVDPNMQHGLLVDVTVDADGRMLNYEILAGPSGAQAQRELDQVLTFARFRPMMSFGRPTSNGHVVLSFSQVRVRE